MCAYDHRGLRHYFDVHPAARTSEAFQSGWVLAHLDDAEAAVQKPLLLEEFGKKLRQISCCKHGPRVFQHVFPHKT